MWYKIAKKHWGYHLILDMSGLNDNIKSKDRLKAFTKELVDAIGMKSIGEPVIKKLLKGEPNEGYDVTQLIETSSITFHVVDKDNTGYLDVFSCKEFAAKDALDVVKKYFNPNKIKQKFIYRDAPKDN